jgi:hypothetical protein
MPASGAAFEPPERDQPPRIGRPPSFFATISITDISAPEPTELQGCRSNEFRFRGTWQLVGAFMLQEWRGTGQPEGGVSTRVRNDTARDSFGGRGPVDALLVQHSGTQGKPAGR